MDLRSWPETTLENSRDWAQDLREVVAAVSVTSPELSAFSANFRRPNDSIVLVQPNIAHAVPWQHTFGRTAFAEKILGQQWGAPQPSDARVEAALGDLLERLEDRKFPHSVTRIGRGGLAVALALGCQPHGCLPRKLGVRVNFDRPESEAALQAYFGEEPSRLLLTCKGHAHFALSNFIEYGGRFIATAIGRVTDGEFLLEWEKEEFISTRL